ncbi:terminase large subunit domain-containing protein [Agrococcus casei]|uniref:terminase large subunit domain-containing protein n=1 Tax=Agrococcus casei TaxID=343512 RepID=UPI003F8EEDCC
MTQTTAMPPPSTDPAALELLAALPLEDGTRWGKHAEAFQLTDACAVLDSHGPRRHYLLRGRGMSKTTDVAAIVLVLLLTEAPAGSNSHVYAADEEQAELTLDAMRGFVDRAQLGAQLRVSASNVTNTTTGATVTVETSDGASAFGKRPWLQVVDELAVWPNTSNARTLWSAIVSAVPKVPGSRLIVITTAGSPVGIGARVWAEAEASPHWRTSRSPGPAPWWSADDIEATRAALSASEYRRLILCEWAEGDDALTSPEDVEAAIRSGSAVLPRRPGVEYVAALDVGTRRDLTALVVGHAEQRPEGRVVVIDRVLSWRPSDHGGRVDLARVEETTLRVCREYGAKLRFDRMQAEQLTGNIAREGIRTEEYVFTSAGANRLARSLWGSLRDRALSLPDDDELRREFLAVRLVETGPGTVKLQNPPGTHDDIVVAVGMVVADLTERPSIRPGSITMPGSSTALGSTPAALAIERQRAAAQIPTGVMARRPGFDPEGARRIAAEHSLSRRERWR